MMLILRSYQRQSVDSIYQYYTDGYTGNVLVVLPTASGKSLVMATFIQETLSAWPDQKILMLTHVKELIEQNEAELLTLWPEAPAGVYSAGLGRREVNPLLQKITIAGIQSVFKKSDELGAYDLILVDECHLIPVKGEGMYRSFLEAQERMNPDVKVIGFTATPYRLGSGLLTEGKNRIFEDICFEKNVGELVKEGYLSPLVSKGGTAKADLSDVKIRGGEYVADQLAAACDKTELIRSAIDEVMWYCEDRNSWLLFCASVEHAGHVRDELAGRGIVAEMVHGDTPAVERDRIITEFKSGAIRAVTNVGVLTTGFNHPGLDALVMLRPTKSTSLYVQMLGRGMRKATGKEDCLVLDFSGNVMEHGPIDHIEIKKCNQSGRPEVKKAPSKECPKCCSIIHASFRKCPDCSYEWPERELKHEQSASDMKIMGTTTKYVPVTDVTYKLHHKEGSPTSVKVTYCCGLSFFSEWVCIEHRGYAQEKAWHWWLERMTVPFPETSEKALKLIREHQPAIPLKIKVKIGSKFPEILKVIFDDNSSGKARIDTAA